ncbi:MULTISPECIES: membrane protein insertion efficiency factor YidD [Streptomyces]|uniref:Putative membrane protein insertion efficiency factor n=1 Tax=Streptomyces solicathayae TaxID=3081768 RepID=A0ABZ0M5B8_9ACTN|nr:membrane protein insertion efficiency factor YidD [Streptomyces sp. HUAS YS2]WOX26278.1 membrane protein insertion efficiency factor YidD [Streptomyces sp. HUAS YS2]
MADEQRKPRKRKKSDEDGCCVGVLDTCSAYGPCCSIFSLTAVFGMLVRPARPSVDPAAPRPLGRVAGTLYQAVRYYRTEVSPMLPPCCPYTPSCSTYAVQALHRHGARRGVRLVVARLLRCRPGAARRRGFRDPVPE